MKLTNLLSIQREMRAELDEDQPSEKKSFIIASALGVTIAGIIQAMADCVLSETETGDAFTSIFIDGLAAYRSQIMLETMETLNVDGTIGEMKQIIDGASDMAREKSQAKSASMFDAADDIMKVIVSRLNVQPSNGRPS